MSWLFKLFGRKECTHEQNIVRMWICQRTAAKKIYFGCRSCGYEKTEVRWL